MVTFGIIAGYFTRAGLLVHHLFTLCGALSFCLNDFILLGYQLYLGQVSTISCRRDRLQYVISASETGVSSSETRDCSL